MVFFWSEVFSFLSYLLSNLDRLYTVRQMLVPAEYKKCPSPSKIKYEAMLPSRKQYSSIPLKLRPVKTPDLADVAPKENSQPITKIETSCLVFHLHFDVVDKSLSRP